MLLPDITLAAVNLYSFNRYIHCHLRSLQFGHGSRRGIRHLLVLEPGSPPTQQTSGFDRRSHICQLELYRLVLNNRLSKGLSLLSVGQSQIISSRRYAQPSTIKYFHSQRKTKALLTYAVFDGYFDIGKHDGMGIGASNTQFIFLFAYRKAFPALVYNKC